MGEIQMEIITQKGDYSLQVSFLWCRDPEDEVSQRHQQVFNQQIFEEV
jgi:hypothetical protein